MSFDLVRVVVRVKRQLDVPFKQIRRRVDDRALQLGPPAVTAGVPLATRLPEASADAQWYRARCSASTSSPRILSGTKRSGIPSLVPAKSTAIATQVINPLRAA